MGGWLGDIADWVGSAFDGDGPGASSNGGTAIPTPQNRNEGNGLWSSDFLGAALTAGVGLAGTYFKTSQDKKLAEEAMRQRMAEIEAAKKGGGGGGGAGAALKIARMNNLQQLYSNWAALTEKGGEAAAQSADETGKLMTEPINIRSSVLR